MAKQLLQCLSRLRFRVSVEVIIPERLDQSPALAGRLLHRRLLADASRHVARVVCVQLHGFTSAHLHSALLRCFPLLRRLIAINSHCLEGWGFREELVNQALPRSRHLLLLCLLNGLGASSYGNLFLTFGARVLFDRWSCLLVLFESWCIFGRALWVLFRWLTSNSLFLRWGDGLDNWSIGRGNKAERQLFLFGLDWCLKPRSRPECLWCSLNWGSPKCFGFFLLWRSLSFLWGFFLDWLFRDFFHGRLLFFDIFFLLLK